MSYGYTVDRLSDQVDELLARHEVRRDLADFEKYRGRPLEFMREELGFHPYGKQVEVIESFHAHKRVAVRGNHGAGKDAVLAPLMLYAAYVCRMLVLGISATEKQLLGQLWREVGNRFSDRLPGELYTADLRIEGKKRIVTMTSASVSNLTGWHDPNGVFIAISEGQGEQTEATAFDAAIANAVDDASRIMVVGNPVKSAGRFYEVSQKNTWHAIRISAFDHPNVIEGRDVIAGGPGPTWPTEMAAEFGKDSPWYISRVLGEFPPLGTLDSLVRREWLEAAYERHDTRPGFEVSPPPVVALDVARSMDRDESVAAVVQGSRVLALHAWRSRDLVKSANRFLEIADRGHLEWHTLAQIEEPWRGGRAAPPGFRLYVDAPGVGSGVVDECRRQGRSVVEYWGWTPASDEKRFANLRAEVHWNFRTLLETGQAALPRDAALQEEALSLEWSQDSKGRILMLPKDELRKALGRSPDRLDAVCIGLAAATGSMRPGNWGTATWIH